MELTRDCTISTHPYKSFKKIVFLILFNLSRSSSHNQDLCKSHTKEDLVKFKEFKRETTIFKRSFCWNCGSIKVWHLTFFFLLICIFNCLKNQRTWSHAFFVQTLDLRTSKTCKNLGKEEEIELVEKMKWRFYEKLVGSQWTWF